LVHLEVQQLGEQDWLVTLIAAPAKTQHSAEEVACRTASFSKQTLSTFATLVHGVRHQRATSPQFGAELPVIDLR
jgi:hypothetical protein